MNLAEIAGVDDLLNLLNGRAVAVIMADAEGEAGVLYRVGSAFAICLLQRERFLG